MLRLDSVLLLLRPGDRISDKEDHPDLKAWVCALRTSAHENELLVKCLGRALCLASSSTSSIERDFGNLTCTFHKRVSRPMLKEMHVRLTSFLQREPGMRDDLVEHARKVWCEGFRPQRLSGQKRPGNFVSGIRVKKRQVALPVGPVGYPFTSFVYKRNCGGNPCLDKNVVPFWSNSD